MATIVSNGISPNFLGGICAHSVFKKNGGCVTNWGQSGCPRTLAFVGELVFQLSESIVATKNLVPNHNFHCRQPAKQCWSVLSIGPNGLEMNFCHIEFSIISYFDNRGARSSLNNLTLKGLKRNYLVKINTEASTNEYLITHCVVLGSCMQQLIFLFI